MTDYLEARRERNIRERANRPYFKRVLDEMQNFATSGYQAEQTAFHSIHLRPRTNPFRPPGVQEFDDTLKFGITNPRSIITRLRIWVRKAMKRRMQFSQDYNSHLGGFARNMVNRGGWQVNASLRSPHSYGVAIPERRYRNAYGRMSTASLDQGTGRPVWKKNERLRLF